MIAAGGMTIDPSAPLLPTLGLMVFLLACSFYFSGTETALFSLQAIDRQHLLGAGRLGRIALRLLERRATTLTTILMGNEFANTALAATSAALVARFAPAHPWVNVVVLTPVLVLVSEITPKYLAYRTNRSWALVAAPILMALAIAVTPLRWVFERIVFLFARIFRADAHAITEGLEEAELMVLVDRGTAAGALDESARDIIGNVFELEAITIDRTMTPRPDIFAVPVDIGWDDLLALCKEKRLSRVPVFDRRVEDIVGVLLVKDLLRLRDTPEKRASRRWLYPLLLPPIFVPASKSADAMFREFIRRKYHMAFVVDEHGTLVGLVTLDDLVNELLGWSEETDEAEIHEASPDVFTVKAGIDLEDFEEETGITLPEGEYHTVGGFVFHRFGRLPRRGEAIESEGLRFVVSAMEGRRIAEVEISRLQKEAV